MKHYAGLDLSMETTQVCIVDENGQKLVSEKVESSPEVLASMLEHHGPIERAVVETGRMSPAICLGLRELGVPVVCIDARQAHQSLKAMKANKTDPHDAAGWHNWPGQASTRRSMSNPRQRMGCVASSPHVLILSKHASGSTT
ncbi:transposase [Paracoccus onubensis]|uniref:IS110 family transposase n=1 Tax=Paracoccus onubensis TaxID=1675788 RepID=UPI00272F6FF6|nr:transposase [Paracoccus onubensis]MDP0929937.1 transposase [Paracoccus onubensis]